MWMQQKQPLQWGMKVRPSSVGSTGVCSGDHRHVMHCVYVPTSLPSEGLPKLFMRTRRIAVESPTSFPSEWGRYDPVPHYFPNNDQRRTTHLVVRNLLGQGGECAAEHALLW